MEKVKPSSQTTTSDKEDLQESVAADPENIQRSFSEDKEELNKSSILQKEIKTETPKVEAPIKLKSDIIEPKEPSSLNTKMSLDKELPHQSKVESFDDSQSVHSDTITSNVRKESIKQKVANAIFRKRSASVERESFPKERKESLTHRLGDMVFRRKSSAEKQAEDAGPSALKDKSYMLLKDLSKEEFLKIITEKPKDDHSKTVDLSSQKQNLADKTFRRRSSDVHEKPKIAGDKSKSGEEEMIDHPLQKQNLIDKILRRRSSDVQEEQRSTEDSADDQSIQKQNLVNKIFRRRSSDVQKEQRITEKLADDHSREIGEPSIQKQNLVDKIFRRRSSDIQEEPRLKPNIHQKHLKSPDDEVSSVFKHSLKRSEGSPVTFFPLVEVKEEEVEEDEHSSVKKASVYNPFGSFQKRVSLARPEENRSPRSGSPQGSIVGKRLSTGDNIPRSNSIAQERKRSIPTADLTNQNIAVCFFPEVPGWDDDLEEDELHEKRRAGSIFPDPRSSQDWTKRERWESRLVYLLALVSYSISFSNIYHFPTLVYQHGGISFLIPYTIFTVILGYPLHFLETSLGQYSQSGPVRVWDCAPLARGVGWSMFLLCLGVGYYHNMYAAYSVVYFSRCFNKVLPWQDCDEPANPFSNYSCVPRMCTRSDKYHYTPAEHYFFDHVLQIRYSDKILSNGLGPMVWTEVLGFLLAWIFIYFAIIQGVRSIGKVVFFLVILPYFVLFMLLTAGFLLKGSSRGIEMLFGTNTSQLIDIQVWRKAAEQVFFELGICQGIPLTYGSYCRHSNPTHIDSAIICCVNYFTSILCAVVVFNILGALSLEMGVHTSEVIQSSSGLVYITYPEVLSRVSGSHFWCFSFFLMLFSVAIGTQIAIMETVLTVVYDEFFNAKPYRWLINLLICCCLFLLGIILCTSNGFFVVHLLDRMTGTMPRLPIAVCMVGTIILIYGITKYCEDMHFMLNYYPNWFTKLSFLIIPFLLVGLTIPSWFLMQPLVFRGKDYTMDAIMVGWFTIWFILVWIVLGAFYWMAYCYYIGHLKDVWRSLNSWGPRSYKARVSRTEFTSEDISNFTRSWTKRRSYT